MDSNQTQFYLLLGRENWARCTDEFGEPVLSTAPGMQPNFEWEEGTNEIRLGALPMRLAIPPTDQLLTLASRRGAARDRFGNWYWIAASGTEIRVTACEVRGSAHFWTTDDCAKCPPLESPGSFYTAAPKPARVPGALSGLTVTDDHYLVVGTLEPAGLLVFDLHTGGPPRALHWPTGAEFAPFDFSPRHRGGLWILDREHKRCWALDRLLQIVGVATPPDETRAETFQPTPARVRRETSTSSLPTPVDLLAENPISIETLPDDSVLVLDVPEGQPCRVWHCRLNGAAQAVQLNFGDAAAPPGILDFALVRNSKCEGKGWTARLYFVSTNGQQCFCFRIADLTKPLELELIKDFFPMRLFSGKALVAASGDAWYDCGERWVPLKAQLRPRFVVAAELLSPVFDGHEPQCVWHRLLFDACLPGDANIEVASRAGDDREAITDTPWQGEPTPRRRTDGPEQPFTARATRPDRGTWELLFQRAEGRFLQLKLTFSGNGRTSPRLHALRVWYPRFSYLDRYLPAVYRESSNSASFLDRFLANFEGITTTIEDRIAMAQVLFSAQTAPPDALEWLANWFGLALDPAWNEHKRRLMIAHAMKFFEWRGTIRGLRMALRLAIEEDADETIFADTPKRCVCAERIRIIERFRTRRMPASWYGARGNPWRPDVEDAKLKVQLQLVFLGTAPPAESEAEDDLATRQRTAARAREELGFVAIDSSQELAAWQDFVRERYGDIESYRDATNSTANTFEEIELPTGAGIDEITDLDWQDFQRLIASSAHGERRRLWQSFLTRRYRHIERLRMAYSMTWKSFADVPYPTALPANATARADWFDFEAFVLPAAARAHRFSVLLPVKPSEADMDELPMRRRALVERITALEKPAHTVFEVGFYWALFRVGEARLGIDTTLGVGSGDARLLRHAVLNQSFLGSSRLSGRPPHSARDRFVLGRDALPFNREERS